MERGGGGGLGGYAFKEKHRGQMKNHLLSGITAGRWLGLLAAHWRSIDWFLPAYWPRLAFLTCFSVFTSLVAAAEWLLYGRAWKEVQLHPAPVFILGHPRTGTTHIHNLLAMDPRFAYVNTFQAGFPSTFLILERFSWLLKPLIDPTRPMDNMPLHFDLPGEEEIATNVLSGGYSAYMPLMFMRICMIIDITRALRDWRYFEKFYTLEGASPDEAKGWTEAFLTILRKATLRQGGGRRPLLIKSPANTAKVPLLLKLFPEARFIYVHRNPYEVFQSAAHMADSYYWYCYLQRPSDADVESFVLSQGELLHDSYTASRGLIPRGRLVEVAFEDLEARPLSSVQEIYEGLGLGRADVEGMRERYAAYSRGGLKDFRRNNHRPLSKQMAAVVRRRWRGWFDTWGYSEDESGYVEEEEEGARA